MREVEEVEGRDGGDGGNGARERIQAKIKKAKVLEVEEGGRERTREGVRGEVEPLEVGQVGKVGGDGGFKVQVGELKANDSGEVVTGNTRPRAAVGGAIDGVQRRVLGEEGVEEGVQGVKVFRVAGLVIFRV